MKVPPSTADPVGGQPISRRALSRRQFVGTTAGVAGAALGAWLWVPLLSHAQTTAPPKPTAPAGGTATPTPVPKPRIAQAPVGQGVHLFLEFPDATRGAGTPLTVTGESLDAAHPNTIELISAWLGIANTVSIGSAQGGAGGGKATFDALRVVKAVDATSPSLLTMAGEGSNFPQANLYLRQGNGPDDLAIYRFKLVMVSAIAIASADDTPRETVHFGFGAMEITYPAQAAGGSATPAAWSVVENQPVFDVGALGQ